MRILRRSLRGFFVLLVFLPGHAMACGPRSDCEIGDRTYRVRMPAGHDGETPVGAIVFAHGYRGTAAGVMNNRSLANMTSGLGVALIAAQAKGLDWSIPGAPSHARKKSVDELAYFEALVSDAAARFPIDVKRLLASGFSAGGMMTWNLACHRSGLFAGFAPIAGTFWQPEPETCTTAPASIVHVHGTEDTMVPLEGRPIANTRQGDVARVFDMYIRYGGFSVTTNRDVGSLRCMERRNQSGRILELCLFKGGHSFRPRFVEYAWKRLLG